MTREDLKKYKYSQLWIKQQLERYEELKTTVLNITSTLDGLPHAQNKPNYMLEQLMDSFNDILTILKEDQQEQNKIILQLRKLNEPYRTILTDKYILGKSLEEIATNINYSYYRVCRMHGEALDMFDKL